MNVPTSDPVGELREAVAAAAADLRGDGPAPLPTLERPPRPDFGDYSTNAAMMLAPTLGEQPRATAERLGAVLDGKLGEAVDRVEVAGPTRGTSAPWPACWRPASASARVGPSSPSG